MMWNSFPVPHSFIPELCGEQQGVQIHGVISFLVNFFRQQKTGNPKASRYPFIVPVSGTGQDISSSESTSENRRGDACTWGTCTFPSCSSWRSQTSSRCVLPSSIFAHYSAAVVICQREIFTLAVFHKVFTDLKWFLHNIWRQNRRSGAELGIGNWELGIRN